MEFYKYRIKISDDSFIDSKSVIRGYRCSYVAFIAETDNEHIFDAYVLDTTCSDKVELLMCALPNISFHVESMEEIGAMEFYARVSELGFLEDEHNAFTLSDIGGLAEYYNSISRDLLSEHIARGDIDSEEKAIRAMDSNNFIPEANRIFANTYQGKEREGHPVCYILQTDSKDYLEKAEVLISALFNQYRLESRRYMLLDMSSYPKELIEDQKIPASELYDSSFGGSIILKMNRALNPYSFSPIKREIDYQPNMVLSIFVIPRDANFLEQYIKDMLPFSKFVTIEV